LLPEGGLDTIGQGDRMDRRIVPIALVFISQCLSFSAQATLGEAAWSLETDRQALKGAPSREISRLTRSQPYEVHEIVSDAVTVREYLNPKGIVFGMAWKGRAHPDLSRLLGGYHEDFQKHSAPPKGRFRTRGNQRAVHGARVVVERAGRMRALTGRAYIPSLLPAGVKPDAIR
jgi:hypothetical protein